MSRNTRTMLTVAVAGLGLLGSGVEAKPGKGKGKGGPPGHAEKAKKRDKKPSGKPQKGKNPGKPAHADKSDKGKPHKGNKPDEKVRVRTENWRFVDEDRRRVLDYFGDYRDEARGLPPGLAKNLRRGKPLPPGWQKKLSPGYVIEDSWWKMFTPVSDDYFPKLKRHDDTALYLHGDRLVRVYKPRREVVDVIIVPTIRIDP